MSNLQHASKEIRLKVLGILENPAIHELTKDIIRKGLHKDCIDAYYDTQLAASLLQEVMQDLIQPKGTKP